MTAIGFEAFGKIPRLFRDMVITEKIDGTNAAIRFEPIEGSDNPVLYCQSRNRLITPEDDNFGFARWARENYEGLFAILGYGLHFGEWWGCGIQRGYGLSEKRFSLFNTKRWGWLEIPEARRDRNPPEQLHVVPTLRQWTFDTDKIIGSMADLERDGSAAAPGYMKPEGIVVYHTAGSVMFKATLDGDAAKSEMALAA